MLPVRHRRPRARRRDDRRPPSREVRSTFEGLLAGDRRARRFQPPGAARRAHGVAGQRAALLLEVRPPDRVHVQPGLRRGHAGAAAAPREVAGRAVRGPVRPRSRSGRADRSRCHRRERGAGNARRCAIARRRPDRPHVPRARCEPRCAPTRTATAPTLGVQVRPDEGARPARSRVPRTRSSCARRVSRVCTFAAGRSPAAVCDGATAPRTTAPRSSVWSRPRW